MARKAGSSAQPVSGSTLILPTGLTQAQLDQQTAELTAAALATGSTSSVDTRFTTSATSPVVPKVTTVATAVAPATAASTPIPSLTTTVQQPQITQAPLKVVPVVVDSGVAQGVITTAGPLNHPGQGDPNVTNLVDAVAPSLAGYTNPAIVASLNQFISLPPSQIAMTIAASADPLATAKQLNDQVNAAGVSARNLPAAIALLNTAHTSNLDNGVNPDGFGQPIFTTTFPSDPTSGTPGINDAPIQDGEVNVSLGNSNIMYIAMALFVVWLVMK